MRKVKVAYNNLFRCLMNIPRAARISISSEFGTVNIDSFGVVRGKSCVNLGKRLLISNKNLLKNATSLHFFAFSSITFTAFNL